MQTVRAPIAPGTHRIAAVTPGAAPPSANAVARLRTGFDSGRTRPLAWRREQLQALRRLLADNEPVLHAALARDLGKPATESYVTEIGFTIGEIDYALRRLRGWMRDRRVPVPLALQPARARVSPQPLGVVLVIAPWNYPVQLLLAPLCGALAAGNCVVLKPSELAPATAGLLAELVPRYLDPEAVAVVQGGEQATTALLAERFDHIMFTGGGRVARIVMAAAARHLTPVTLELGGKCPVIVSDGDLRAAARRIAYGKFLNAGQTCVAPDHVLVVEEHTSALVEYLSQALHEFFGEDPARSADFGRIIDDRHFQRLVNALDGAPIAAGGGHDRATRYIEPTLVVDPAADSPLMDEEIFGPILPIVPVRDVADALERISRGPAPLAAYVFTAQSEVRALAESRLRAGAIGINVCTAHVAVPGLPFGGVGGSGMGAYHGRHSFETFSQLRPLFTKGTVVDTLRFAYPPYSRLKTALLRRLM